MSLHIFVALRKKIEIWPFCGASDGISLLPVEDIAELGRIELLRFAETAAHVAFHQSGILFEEFPECADLHRMRAVAEPVHQKPLPCRLGCIEHEVLETQWLVTIIPRSEEIIYPGPDKRTVSAVHHNPVPDKIILHNRIINEHHIIIEIEEVLAEPRNPPQQCLYGQGVEYREVFFIPPVYHPVVNDFQAAALTREIFFHKIAKTRILTVRDNEDISDIWSKPQDRGDAIIDFSETGISDIAGDIIFSGLSGQIVSGPLFPMFRGIPIYPGYNRIYREICFRHYSYCFIGYSKVDKYTIFIRFFN